MTGPQRRGVGDPLHESDHPVSVRIRALPSLDDAWIDRLTDIWFEVAVAGGAVGLVAPFERTEARSRVEEIADSASVGSSLVLVAVPSDASADLFGNPLPSGEPGTRYTQDDLVAWVRVERNTMPIVAHWAWIRQLMVLPSLQGLGLGSQLLRVAEAKAFGELDLEAVYLTCRSETGLEAFYAGHGYHEVGRMPGNLKMTDGERRDEIYFVKASLPGSPP